jgi:hypothetical protein
VTAFLSRLPGSLQPAARWALAHSNVVMFVAGFLFDVLTIGRIDSRIDLAIQLLYLFAITSLIVLQHREERRRWTPPAPLRRLWTYNLEVLHFFYGGLLSAYVILYFRSSTGARPLVFFLMLVGLFVLNEMPQIRRAGHRLRLGLYAFCVLSFFNYFVPILVGRMNGWVFLLAWLLSLAVVWLLASWLAPPAGAVERGETPRLPAASGERAAERRRLFAPGAIVCAVVAVLYLARLIPPVPMSVTFQGIYHEVRRHPGGYTLVYERPHWWRRWRHDSRPFRAAPGDRVHYFMRVFAPARFSQQIFTRWERQDASGIWQTTNRIELPVVRGGRADGFRTFARKSNFEPGRWRVTAETDDGRALATVTFSIEPAAADEPRTWVSVEG